MDIDKITDLAKQNGYDEGFLDAIVCVSRIIKKAQNLDAAKVDFKELINSGGAMFTYNVASKSNKNA